jgi:hypothetical protein
MPNHQAIHSVGSSIVQYLQKTYPAGTEGHPDCQFALMSSRDMAAKSDPPTRISLYLYKITVSPHLRNATSGKRLNDISVPLSVDLHYLLTAWAGAVATEQLVFAWAMRQLHMRPLLDSSILSREAGWDPADVIQLIEADLSTEDMMRIWDALDPPYHLSVAYVARVVRIDADEREPARPVVATRFGYTDQVPPEDDVQP